MVWEYKAVKVRTKGFLGGELDVGELDSMMNALGREGWELAAAFDTNEASGNTRDVVILFKRQADG